MLNGRSSFRIYPGVIGPSRRIRIRVCGRPGPRRSGEGRMRRPSIPGRAVGCRKPSAAGRPFRCDMFSQVKSQIRDLPGGRTAALGRPAGHNR